MTLLAVGCSQSTTIPWSWTPQPDQFQERREILADTSGISDAYPVAVTFDHASLVADGKARADGADLRIFGVSGELPRVLDSGSAWNTPTTTVWFPWDGSETLYLYYGNPSAGAPLDDADQVFPFADDFEAASLSQWDSRLGNVFRAGSGIAHSGTGALVSDTVDNQQTWLVANGIDLDDVTFDAWWYFEGDVDFDVAQGVRAGGTLVNQYETNIEGTNGWYVAKIIDGVFDGLSDHGGVPEADTWTRVTVSAVGTEVLVELDGTPILDPPWLDVGTDLTDGSVSLRAYYVPPGTTWRIDDVTVRPRMEPEPEISLGNPETLN